MKKNSVYFLLWIGSMFFAFSSCQKNNNSARSDGSMILKSRLAHHDIGIPGGTIHFKFSASKLPVANSPNSKMHIKRHDVSAFVIITTIKEGNCHFYSSSFDRSVSQYVMRGSAFSFAFNEGNVRLVI